MAAEPKQRYAAIEDDGISETLSNMLARDVVGFAAVKLLHRLLEYHEVGPAGSIIAVPGGTHGGLLYKDGELRVGQRLPRDGLKRKVAHHPVLTFPLLMAFRRAATRSRNASLALFQLKMAAVIAPSGAK